MAAIASMITLWSENSKLLIEKEAQKSKRRHQEVEVIAKMPLELSKAKREIIDLKTIKFAFAKELSSLKSDQQKTNL